MFKNREALRLNASLSPLTVPLRLQLINYYRVLWLRYGHGILLLSILAVKSLAFVNPCALWLVVAWCR